VPCTPTSGIASAGVLTQRAVHQIAPSQWVTLRTISPEGELDGEIFGILGEAYATGATPLPALPGLASSLAPASLILLTPSALQAPPTTFDPFPTPGFQISFCWPSGLSGTSFLLQTVVVTPIAANGVFATSNGMELRAL
jgi:hypothetical protein